MQSKLTSTFVTSASADPTNNPTLSYDSAKCLGAHISSQSVISRTFKAFSMTSKVHVPIQFPGAIPSSDSASAGSRWIGKWWIPVVWDLVHHPKTAPFSLRRRRATKSFRPLPTLVVGSVELGGSGKTPHVIDFAHRLGTILGSSTVGVLSRGMDGVVQSSSGFLRPMIGGKRVTSLG